MDLWSVTSVFLFAIFSAIPGNESKFINFTYGFEYVYRYEGHVTIKDLGNFIMSAKVGYTNIMQIVTEDQEILLKVYTINVVPEQNQDVNGIENDFSKWFSFVISSRGVVNHVFHPGGEDEEVVALKKGLASIFAAKLHEEGEIPGISDSGRFTYNVSELGGEGKHNSTYTVSSIREGKEFKKTRHNHPVKNAKASYQKTMVYHDYLGTIHSILIEENFTSPKTPQGFNPLHGMRKVKAVNEFSTTEYPSMSYTSQGNLTFVSRLEDKKEWIKPADQLLKAPIKIDKVRHIPKHLNLTEIRIHIATNLTCIENQPQQGSPSTAICFLNIVNQLKKLPDDEVERIAQFYFSIVQPTTDTYKKAKENMIDAFGAMGTELTEKMLAEKIMLSPSPDADLVKRILTHVATNDKIPSEIMLKALEDAVFHQEKFPSSFYARDTHSRCMLALGAVSHKLMKEGKAEKARKIINKIHSNLGLHGQFI